MIVCVTLCPLLPAQRKVQYFMINNFHDKFYLFYPH